MSTSQERPTIIGVEEVGKRVVQFYICSLIVCDRTAITGQKNKEANPSSMESLKSIYVCHDILSGCLAMRNLCLNPL